MLIADPHSQFYHGREGLKHYAFAFFGSTPVASTPPRNLTTELTQTLAGYQQTAPGYLALNQQYQPAYAQLSQQIQAGLQPGQQALTSSQRGADIADVYRYGPAAVQAQLQANPYLAGSLNNLYGRTGDSPLLQQLNSQAKSGLDQGGRLSSQDVNDITQATRAGFSQRGQLMGNQSLGADLLARDQYARQRLASAQQFGSTVQGLNQNQNDFVGRASQIFGTQLSDPYLAILGRGSTAGTSGQQIGTGAQLFDPTNPYAADIYSSNQNATAAANIANANSSNAANNTTLSTIGTLAGAALIAFSDKRLKKDIKKVGETAEGQKLYEFSYKGDKKKRRYVSGMADEIEKKHPNAIIKMPLTGFKLVDLQKAKVPFYEVLTKKAA